MQRKYIESDVSNRQHPRLSFVRRGTPLGAEVHTTAGTNSLEYLLQGSVAAGKPASADCLITRAGKRYRLTPLGRGAYHAGIGSYTVRPLPPGSVLTLRNDEVSNAFLGIELECLDDQIPTLEQVDSLAEYIVLEGIRYGWRWPYNIVGHYATARPIGRRSDPVNFDWGQFAGRLYARAAEKDIPGIR